MRWCLVLALDTTKARSLNSPARLRVAQPGDAAAVRAIALDNGLFTPRDIGTFDDALSDYFEHTPEGHQWIVVEQTDGDVVGAAYYASEPFGDRVWNLYFIGVRPDHHRAGIGGQLATHVEDTLNARGAQAARVLIVETSSLDGYDRAFYRSHGYVDVARIREFYGPGDDKIVFWKLLAGAHEGNK